MRSLASSKLTLNGYVVLALLAFLPFCAFGTKPVDVPGNRRDVRRIVQIRINGQNLFPSPSSLNGIAGSDVCK